MKKNGHSLIKMNKIACLCGAALMMYSTISLADMAPFSLNSPYLFGDWGGYRTKLKEAGVDFQVNYTMESASNLAGGYRTATTARYTDQWAFGTTLDLEKLLNWNDTQFQFTLTDRNGQDLTPYLNDPRAGGLSSVEELYGRGQTWRLTQFWLNKGFFDHLIEVKAGRVTVGEDFASFQSNFQNLAFGSGQPGNWRGDRWFNWPVSQWGGRVKFNLAPEWDFQVGFYNQNASNYDTGNGFRMDAHPTLGNMVPVELGWKPTFGAEKLPGNYRVGAYYSSVKGDRYTSYDNGRYGATDHAWGGYLLLQQQLTATDGDNQRGLNLTVQTVVNDRRTSKTDNYQSVSLVWKGPFSARSQDEIGVGAARIHVNGHYSEMQRRVNQENGISDSRNPGYLPIQHGSEYNYELYYNARVTPWLSLRPNLQYVSAPGAVSSVKDAFVGGLSANVNF